MPPERSWSSGGGVSCLYKGHTYFYCCIYWSGEGTTCMK
jgi:hypothetical protein